VLKVGRQTYKPHLPPGERRKSTVLPRAAEARICPSLKAEPQILHSISAHMPLTEILDQICTALDRQIGDVASLFSLPGDDALERAAIGVMAEYYHLAAFYSEDIVGNNVELLGSLEMYCGVARRPSAGELQLIKRAARLAALAISGDTQRIRPSGGYLPKARRVPATVPTRQAHAN
jgi:hypothetical protein